MFKKTNKEIWCDRNRSGYYLVGPGCTSKSSASGTSITQWPYSTTGRKGNLLSESSLLVDGEVHSPWLELSPRCQQRSRWSKPVLKTQAPSVQIPASGAGININFQTIDHQRVWWLRSDSNHPCCSPIKLEVSNAATVDEFQTSICRSHYSTTSNRKNINYDEHLLQLNYGRLPQRSELQNRVLTEPVMLSHLILELHKFQLG